MKAAVFGLGKMGSIAAHYMNRLGYKVYGFDSNQAARKQFDGSYYASPLTDAFDIDNTKKDLKSISPDVVLSCMPYFENEGLANICAELNVAYCDLGGSVPVSEKLELLADEVDSPIFPDLGLAPGLISLLALRELDKLKTVAVDDILLAVGGMGLNDQDKSPLYYTCNWSLDGLVNEYLDDCLVLNDGVICYEPGLDNPRLLGDEFVTFNTSGGIGNLLPVLQARGIKNARYQTIRNPEHYNLLTFLVDELGYSPEDLRRFLKPALEPNAEDAVMLYIGMHTDNAALTFNKGWSYISGEFSAMQKLTSGTLASVADMIVRNNVRNYEDVVRYWEDFEYNMNTLGINLEGLQK